MRVYNFKIDSGAYREKKFVTGIMYNKGAKHKENQVIQSSSNLPSSASINRDINTYCNQPDNNETTSQKNKIAVVSTYLPRKCGLAIFTSDLCTSLENTSRNMLSIDIIAINDGLEEYQYSSKVKFEISSNVSEDYLQAAAYVNKTGYDAVILQHEFGLFGGLFGEYILNFTENIHVPLYTVLHSVLKQPESEQNRIIHKLGQNSQRLIVMNPMACKMLEEIYSINPQYVKMIHHGVADIPYGRIQRSKITQEFKGKKVLMSYGLIGPGKGFEYVIDALPAILNDHPDVIYIIAGTLHPHIHKLQSDTYLKQLKNRIHKNKLDQHVLMYNHFLKTEEIHRLLNVTDVFIAPYLCQEQITSGTIALAMACGKPIVSTPTWYAQEVLAQNRGVLVPFKDSQTITCEITRLLNSPFKRLVMSMSNYKYSRQMLWKNVSKEFLVMLNGNYKPRIVTRIISSYHSTDSQFKNLPPIKLSHLKTLTDKTGIIQHSILSVPDKKSGYCVDDAARALITANKYYLLFHEASILQNIKCYFNFFKLAFNKETRCFRNLLNVAGEWDGEKGSQDAQGRAFWGLSTLIEAPPTKILFFQAKELFLRSLPAINEFIYPRPISFSILGMYGYLKAFPNDKQVSALLEEMTYKLFNLYQSHQIDSWLWFEDKLTYDNAKLPHALLIGSHFLNRTDIFSEARRSLKWLINMQTNPKGYLSVIGNKDWGIHNKPNYHFDQQPLEVMALVHACADCYRLTKDSDWRDHASWCFQWFLGENHIHQPMFNKETGAGYDGFSETERNENQGAEATISWLFSWLEIFDIFLK